MAEQPELKKELAERKQEKQENKPKAPKAPKAPKQAQKPKEKASKAAPADTKGITIKKEEDLADWYSQILLKGQFISYYDISGCYILEPPSYAIWESIKTWFDKKIKAIGVRNCYYPVFISKANLEKEQTHIAEFSAEVAWVTQGGTTKLDPPIAVRPTSETAMYKDYSSKIQSYRDLPLRRNQWNNVVRWEFKQPTPFIRSREFLWQEGHTCHFDEAGAGEEVLQILDFYAGVYEELLACPVVKGRKTVNEQFPGAHYTTTIEGYIPANGRGVQAATSHCLGQNFSKMYNITVENPEPMKDGEDAEKYQKRLFVWQNSWGLTTRSIGVMMLTHGDDKGAVIPPRVAEIQAILLPVGVTAKTSAEDKDKLYNAVTDIESKLLAAEVRVEKDVRDNYSAGWKFAQYELQGIPIRIELGPRDLASEQVVAVRRDTGEKTTLPFASLGKDLSALLEKMQHDMLERARKEYDAHRKAITSFDEIVPALNAKNVVLIPSCLDGKCCDAVKDETAAKSKAEKAASTEAEDAQAPSMGAKALCIPFEQDHLGKLPETCLRPGCGKPAQKWVQFGRSY